MAEGGSKRRKLEGWSDGGADAQAEQASVRDQRALVDAIAAGGQLPIQTVLDAASYISAASRLSIEHVVVIRCARRPVSEEGAVPLDQSPSAKSTAVALAALRLALAI